MDYRALSGNINSNDCRHTRSANTIVMNMSISKLILKSLVLIVPLIFVFIGCEEEPQPQPQPQPYLVTHITAGNTHTCALLSRGNARCWGNGNDGRLGYGDAADVADDELLASVDNIDLGTNRRIIDIAAGGMHTCAIITDATSDDTKGQVACWGDSGRGQLGYGNTNDLGDDETLETIGVVKLGGSLRAVQIAAGHEHTCALLDDNDDSTTDYIVKCWGRNTNGQLGYGNATNIGDVASRTPDTQGAVGGASMLATQVVAGRSHSCALLTDKTVRCWGENGDGQIGNGNTTLQNSPVAVSNLTNVRAIAAGGNNTCALLHDNRVKCWGNDSVGQLGNDSTFSDSNTPVFVAAASGSGNLNNIVDIAVGRNHSCAVTNQGGVHCWGFNLRGQLGIGSTTSRATPVTLTLGDEEQAQQVVAGELHTCIALDNERAKCWGAANNGQLGYGNTIIIGDNENISTLKLLDFGSYLP